MTVLQKGVLGLVITLLVHVAAIVFDWYASYDWFDIPMHFLGGLAVATLALGAWHSVIKKINYKQHLSPVWQTSIYAIGILGSVALIGIAWEWYEFIFDRLMFTYNADFSPAQTSLGDTLADLFLDLLGGLLAFGIFHNQSED